LDIGSVLFEIPEYLVPLEYMEMLNIDSILLETTTDQDRNTLAVVYLLCQNLHASL